jgi:hypothetical protein
MFYLFVTHKQDARCVFTSSCLQEDSCLIYTSCIWLLIVVYNTYCVVVFLFFFVFVLCLRYPMLPVSLGCSFSIAPSVYLTFIISEFYEKSCDESRPTVSDSPHAFSVQMFNIYCICKNDFYLKKKLGYNKRKIYRRGNREWTTNVS